MVRCYSGETYSNGGRRNHMTCKIHPLDSVRLTLNCDAGTLSLDVNGVDQGVVFSNVPPDVHPAVCFYGIAKSVRLVELKRIYGDSDSDSSDSEDESEAEGMPMPPVDEEHEAVPMLQHIENKLAMVAAVDQDTSSKQVDESGDSVERAGGRSDGYVDAEQMPLETHSRTRRRRAARREEEALGSRIRAATAESPSTGLLASLANFAQWYVPRDQDNEEDRLSAPGQRVGGEGDRMARTPSTDESLVNPVSRLFPGILRRKLSV